MITKPTLPQGTRDFAPDVMLKRNYLISTIKQVFVKYGFLPLETPAMENLSVLTGKYGEEGDRLLYKLLNTGDFLKKADTEDFNDSNTLLKKISEKGLRYDLTVPFARFVAANQHDLVYPFKRYQIQPVWRSDRPQKGRYREFYQCDADVVGTKSLVCELEIIQMIREVFSLLQITDYTIKINHREIIRGLSEFIGFPGREAELSVAMDKLDKIGVDGVKKELVERGFNIESAEKLFIVLGITGETKEKISQLKNTLTVDSAQQGLADIETILNYLTLSDENWNHIEIDPSLARGLSYYTGSIFEVKINNIQIGSVSGGGRYDNLTGIFGGKDLPGVGFSFGIDRLYDAILELDLFPTDLVESTNCLIVHFDQESFDYGFSVLKNLRKNGISSEIFPEMAKLKKQLQYANKKNIPNVLFIGSEEIKTGIFTLRNMTDGAELKGTQADIINQLK